MITSRDIREKSFKQGKGYDKSEVDAYMAELAVSFERMTGEIKSLKSQYDTLANALTYYKELENSLKKTMVMAQKLADDTVAAANEKAVAIEEIAKSEGLKIITKAKNEYNDVREKTISLIHQYENYRAQFKRLAMVQFDLINDKSFDVNIANLKADADKFFVDVDFDKMYEEYKTDKNSGSHAAAPDVNVAGDKQSDEEAFAQIDSAFTETLEHILSVKPQTSRKNLHKEEYEAPYEDEIEEEIEEEMDENITEEVEENISKEVNDNITENIEEDTEDNIIESFEDNFKDEEIIKEPTVKTPVIKEVVTESKSVNNDKVSLNDVIRANNDMSMNTGEAKVTTDELNVGVVFSDNSDEDDDLFSLDENKVTADKEKVDDDDEFVFDESTDEDSIGITFDFLDK